MQPQIGLSWAPKIPSFDTRLKHDPTEDAIQNHMWKPESQLIDGLFVPPLDPRKMSKLQKKSRQDTAGSNWFDMPAPTITPAIKKDLEIIKLRSVLDPKRHYKKAGSNSKTLPKYFQIGTVIESSTDFYSSRLTKKQRKASIAEELLSDPNLHAYRKRKVKEISDARQPGGNEKWKRKGPNGKRHKKPRKAML